jgi:hypothetical protein
MRRLVHYPIALSGATAIPAQTGPRCSQESQLDAKSSRSITNMVFVVILVALILGVADLAFHMTQSAGAGPG